jgi:hypothetical protein
MEVRAVRNWFSTLGLDVADWLNCLTVCLLGSRCTLAELPLNIAEIAL